MTRLLVHVEGHTEEAFVNELLAPHLYTVGYTNVSARLVGATRRRSHRGGICTWATVKTEIHRHLSNDVGAFSTTIVDFYALPASAPNGWPGRSSCDDLQTQQKADHIAAALIADFAAQFSNQISQRFVPYVAMHEFEGLLFSDPVGMANGMCESALAEDFQTIRDAFETPEHINDSPHTAPSKRIGGLFPSYNKVLHGNLAAIEVSIPTIRLECPGFEKWISSLEELVP